MSTRLYSDLIGYSERLTYYLVAPNVNKDKLEETARKMYEMLKAEFEPTDPPPLGVSVSETVETKEKLS